jgi:hypothetical protein
MGSGSAAASSGVRKLSAQVHFMELEFFRSTTSSNIEPGEPPAEPGRVVAKGGVSLGI